MIVPNNYESVDMYTVNDLGRGSDEVMRGLCGPLFIQCCCPLLRNLRGSGPARGCVLVCGPPFCLAVLASCGTYLTCMRCRC